jgi:predicted dehydrogenase
VKAALVGAGQIARQHLSCLKETPGIEVVGVCDLSPAVAESMAERFAVPSWFTDYGAMLRSVRPDVVHVTTPPASHFRLALAALDADAHVVLEKPATVTLGELEQLLARAREKDRVVVEDYNYVFNRAPQEILRRIESGEFGAVVHVDVFIALQILGPEGFADPNAPHGALALSGGAIADFLPHAASLAHAFVGAHRVVSTSWAKRQPSVLPYDEFRALVEAERGTATLAFSASTQPDGFWLRVYGEKMVATASLWETRLTFNRLRGGAKPLQPLANGLDEGRVVRREAVRTFLEKFGAGAGPYEGLFSLLRRTYQSLAGGSALPVPSDVVLEVNQLVEALKPQEVRP